MKNNGDFSNPYLSNRKAYSAILEQAASERKGWRLLAFIMAAIAAVAVVGLVWIGSQSKIVPLVVALNGDGIPIKTHLVTDGVEKIDDRYTKAELAEIVRWIRTVTYDRSLHATRLDQMKMFFDTQKPAFERVREYITADETNPFKRAETEIVDVEIQNIVLIKDNIWQIEWLEKIRQRSGALKGEKKYKGVMTVHFLDKIDSKFAMVNPLGLIVDDFVWSDYL